MLVETLNQVIFIVFLAGAVVPLYLTKKFGRSAYGVLSLMLAVFLLLHGFYHLSESLQFDFFADVIFEPTSVLFLLAFALYYYRKSA